MLTRSALAVLLVAAVLTMPSPSSAQQATSAYGVLVNDLRSWSEIGPRMDVAVGVGAGWIRIDFIWAWVEGSAGSFNWTYFDTIVKEADARGLRVVGILWGTPTWAGPSVYGPPTDLTRWDTFVAQTAARYRGKGIVWEIWNEPDTWYWKATPAQYAELLARGYTRIKAADPAATVALGGLAQGGSGAVADFLAKILADSVYPAGRYFDLHNVHTNFRTPSMIATQLSSNRATLARYGLDKPLIVTEASYPSDPVYQTLPNYVGGGQPTQARYVVDVYDAMLANGVLVAFWATGVDYRSNAGAYTTSGLVDTSWTQKEAYAAFRDMTRGGDTAKPNVSITTPGSGTTVKGQTTVTVAAADDKALARVDLYVDGSLHASQSSAPMNASWNTSAIPDGPHTLVARAVDTTGNEGVSPSVTVTVQNADTSVPTVSITAPAAGATVSGVLNVSLAAADNLGVARVDLYVDGQPVASSTTSPFTLSWDTSTVGNGTHTLMVKAYDAAGNEGASASVTVTVNNATVDTTPPVTAIRAVLSSRTSTKVAVTASDDTAVTRVVLLVDGKVFGTSTGGTVFSLNKKWLAPGTHTLQSQAWDAAGNVGVSAVMTISR